MHFIFTQKCSGFPMILNAWKQAGWGEPELKNRLEVDEVALVLPIHRFEGTAPKVPPKLAPKAAPKWPQKYQWVIDKKDTQ